MSLNVVGALFFVGIEWAAAVHAVCVQDPGGRRVAAFTVEHSAAGLADLVRRLARLGEPDTMPVAIERPDGRLVDALLQAGHPVVPVKPNAIKTWRDGEVLSGAKSDTGDAEVIAEYLRLRHHRLHLGTPYSAETKGLRTVVRARSDLVDMRVAATNQLSALQDLHWPGATAVFADVESPIALEFLTRYPTARHAQHLGAKRLTAFCAKHGYSGRCTGEQLLARLRAAPAGTLEETLCEAVRDTVTALVTVLKALGTAPKDIGRSVSAHLGEHPDAQIFTSLPTPVTKESGKHRAVHVRWACNKRFRLAVTTFADNGRHANPLAAKVYTDARGHHHPHATRVLARAWIRVIWRCWINQTPYDPGPHGNAVRLTEPEQTKLLTARG